MEKSKLKFKHVQADAYEKEQALAAELPNDNHPFADITYDVAFKKVFTNEDMLLGLLQELLPELQIKVIDKITTSGYNNSMKEVIKSPDLKYEPQELISALNDRKAIMDITCTTATGDKITIEMQRTDKHHHFSDRSLFYASLEITDQVLRGNLKYSIKPLYAISFLRFRMLDSQSYINRFSLHNDTTGEPYQHNRLHFIYIELPKFKKKEKECTTLLDKIIYTIKHSNTLKKVPDSFKDDEYMKKMFNFALYANYTPEQRKQYIDQMYTAQEYRAILEISKEEARATGLAEGLAEGEAKGKAEGKLETARNMLADNLPIEAISRYTGLTEAEVAALQQN